MNDLLAEVRKLEAQGRMSEIYKEKYENLIDIFTKFAEDVSAIRGRNIRITASNTRRPGMRKGRHELMTKTVEGAYIKMKADDSIQMGTEAISKALEENGINVNNASIVQFRGMLKEKPGIQTRNAGLRLFFYYNEPETSKGDTSEIAAMMPKKFSFKK